MSIPAETPAAVITLPLSTKRSSGRTSISGPSVGSSSSDSQCVVAGLPSSSPRRGEHEGAGADAGDDRAAAGEAADPVEHRLVGELPARAPPARIDEHVQRRRGLPGLVGHDAQALRAGDRARPRARGSARARRRRATAATTRRAPPTAPPSRAPRRPRTARRRWSSRRHRFDHAAPARRLGRSDEAETRRLEERRVLVEGALPAAGRDEHVQVGELRRGGSFGAPSSRSTRNSEPPGAIAARQVRRIAAASRSSQSWMIAFRHVGVAARGYGLEEVAADRLAPLGQHGVGDDVRLVEEDPAGLGLRSRIVARNVPVPPPTSTMAKASEVVGLEHRRRSRARVWLAIARSKRADSSGRWRGSSRRPSP